MLIDEAKNHSMPYLIPDTGFNYKLRHPKKNEEHTKAFLQKGVKDFELPNFDVPYGYRLVKSLKEHEYRMVTISDNSETVYFVKLNFRKDIVLERETCTQIALWRTPRMKHQNAIGNLPRDFFKYLLSKYSIVVTDEAQTQDGKRFWEKMIDWAMVKGYRIYASDGTSDDGEMNCPPLTLISSMTEFYDRWDEFCWRNDKDVHTHRLIVISQNSLLADHSL
ncbi:hypothetical protein [Xenorhabdus miraniensis]|uniref:Phage protein n=1 Tax=Xenorhabdus miraniensis TaxID=351674 RepID=A0A2D0JTJ5_9GAMM|nr:hypothetical protein [Xenorhabdus miraniensis]PHM49659.1 phage protein [Xenorhabdus miraniensis]